MNKSNNTKNRRLLVLMFDFVFQVGLLMILPLVIFAFLGKLVDERTNTSPLFFFVGLVIGLITAGLLVWKKLMEIIKEVESSK